MVEKTHQAYPLAPANGYTRSDNESLSSENKLKRKKRIQCFAYIGIFTVFQILVITVFSLTIMKVKTPKVRLGDSTITDFTSSTTTVPSFGATFNTQVRIKNANWGPYKFDSGVMTFLYKGMTVGTFNVPKGKASMRGTKKINVAVALNNDAKLRSNSTLESELTGGVLTLTSLAKLTGKVELMLIMKKKKSATMNCTIEINVAEKNVETSVCK